jgi:F1F0 ATPase subunit 2
MSVDVTLWGLAFLWGAVLGLFYFGGLWLTLKMMHRKKSPKRWLVFSYILRVTGALAGFWVVVQKDPGAFLFTFLAFFAVRIILTRVLGREGGEKQHAAQP